MNFLKITARDIKKIFKNRFIVISVIAIIITPLFYSFFYLSSFWNPYGNLQNMPVAVVNLDKGTINNNNSVNYGRDLVDQLKTNNDVGWRFVSQSDADKGLTGNKYYGEIIIPEDFSEKALSAKDGTPIKPNIVFKDNPKKNYIATKIYSSVKNNLEDKITKSIVKEYTKVTFDNLYNVKDGMDQAVDGSSQLLNGVSGLKDGSLQLTNGVLSARDGSNQLKTGLANANSGSNQLKTGLASANAGSNQLKAGLGQLSNQVPQLQEGTSNLSKGSNKILDGLNKVGDGIQQINAGVNGNTDNKPSLVTALGKLNDNTKDLGTAIGQLNNAVNVGVKGQPSLADSVKNINEATNNLSDLLTNYNDPKTNESDKASDMQQIMYIMSHLKEGTNELNTAVNEGNSLKAAVAQLNSSVNGKPTLSEAVSGIYDSVTNGLAPSISLLNSSVNGKNSDDKTSLLFGMKQLSNGINDLNNIAPALASGVSQLYAGASTLSNGTADLYNGATTLNQGTNELYSGAVSLNDGTSKLYSGVSELQNGTNKLYDGSKELSSKLLDGAGDLNKNLKNSSTTMSDFVAQPINVETEHLYADETYGVALAPYFIPISIWVGALLMFFVISDEVDKDIEVKAKSIVFGKYLVYIGIGALQAVCVSTAVLFIGIRPSNLFVFYLFNIFISFVFIAIMQCLIFLLKDVGRLLGIILLVLQLASSAGTFPIELSPKFYRVISPFMPFTYVVSGLREVINGINYNIMGKDIAFLMIVFVVFFTLSLTFRGKVIKIHEIIEEKKSKAVA